MPGTALPLPATAEADDAAGSDAGPRSAETGAGVQDPGRRPCGWNSRPPTTAARRPPADDVDDDVGRRVAAGDLERAVVSFATARFFTTRPGANVTVALLAVAVRATAR